MTTHKSASSVHLIPNNFHTQPFDVRETFVRSVQNMSFHDFHLSLYETNKSGYVRRSLYFIDVVRFCAVNS